MKYELKSFLRQYKYIILFLAGILILFVRTSYNLKVPTMYAEDGVWYSNIMHHGFLWTAFNSRQDYDVFLIAGLLKIADIIDYAIFDGDISFIPYIIAIISYCFISFVAVLPSITLGKRINKYGKLFLFLGILLMPMGTTATEIIGKTLQFHFYTWIIAFCLLIYRYDNKDKKRLSILLSDFLILICLEQFPIVVLLIFIYCLLELKRYYKSNFKNIKITWYRLKDAVRKELSKTSTKQFILFSLIAAVLAVRLLIKMAGYDAPDQGTGNQANIIEFLVRGMSYIFVWAFYDHLNLKLGLLILILTFMFYFIGYVYINKESRKTYIIAMLSFIGITIITLSSRFFLTDHLAHFTYRTVPDRYYLLMNYTSLFPISIIISDTFKQNSRKFIKLLGLFIIVYLIVTFMFNNKLIIQGKENRMPWLTNITFKERLNDSYNNNKIINDGSDYLVDIDPWWTMEVPRERMLKSIEKK